MILSICGSVAVLSVLRIVRIAITFLKIAVPILLIVSAMTKYLKSVSNGELEKTNKGLVTQVIAAIAVFIVPTFITLVLDLAWPDSDINQCWVNATGENIARIKIQHVDDLIAKLEDKFSVSAYQLALSAAKEIDDPTEREEMIEKVKSYEEYVDISKEIDLLGSSFSREKYKELYSTIEEIDNDNIRETLLEKIEELGGKPLDVDSGTYAFTSGDLKYNVYIPNGATQNMPLIMYLHGDGGDPAVFYNKVQNIYGNDYSFVIVAPISRDGGNGNADWSGSSTRKANVKNIVDTVCNEYLCDTSRISITGHSRGAIGAWEVANAYPNYFYSVVPVSCRGNISGDNFKNTKVKAFCGNQGDDINYYYSNMKSNVNAINKAGGKAEFIELNAGHGGTPSLAYTKETIEWMIN